MINVSDPVAGDMAGCLRVFVAVVEDLCLVSSIQALTTICNSSSRGPFSGLDGHQLHLWYSSISSQSIHMHKINIKI